MITAEEAISKGIRRIVAVTGCEAEKAEKLAAKYEAQIAALATQVDAAVKSENITAANTAVIDMTKVVEVAQVSVWKRTNLVEKVKKGQF